jgi:hypothetical protein
MSLYKARISDEPMTTSTILDQSNEKGRNSVLDNEKMS